MSKRLRLFVFPTRPDFLLVYVPEGATFTLPLVTSPLDKTSVAIALGPTGQEYSVTETAAGRWTTAMRQAVDAANAERSQRQRESEAAHAHIMRGAVDEIEQDRAGLVLTKHAVDDEIRTLKNKLGNAKARAYETGKYLPAGEYREMERRLGTLQTESLGIQTKLRALRKEEKARNVREAQRNTDAFRQAARELLDQDTLDSLRVRADEIAAETNETNEGQEAGE